MENTANTTNTENIPNTVKTANTAITNSQDFFRGGGVIEGYRALFRFELPACYH